MKIYQVTQVVVYRTSTNPLALSVHATGLTATSGWTKPRLDNSADPKPADAVHEFSFDADKPSGIALEVLTPTSATFDFKPKAADAVIVSSRTNSITVHASEFVTPAAQVSPNLAGQVTTFAIGEEGAPFPKWPTIRSPWGEHFPTTFAIGEEGRPHFPPATSPMVDDPGPLHPFDPLVDPWGPLRGTFGHY